MHCPYCRSPLKKRKFFRKFTCGTSASGKRRGRACFVNETHKAYANAVASEARIIEAVAAQKELEVAVIAKTKMLDGIEPIQKVTDNGLTMDLHCGIFNIKLKGSTFILAKDGVEVWRG